MIFTACNKEEKSLNLLKKDVYYNGKIGDLFENPMNGQKFFFIKEFTKSNQRPRLEDLKNNYIVVNGFFRCEGSGDECLIDNENGIVYVRKGADERK
ncbi:MAG: hypothetical protein N2449_00530 [Bacteroidales bacterium]|nr:hypothetical protein [Bacteroidales bacterium]